MSYTSISPLNISTVKKVGYVLSSELKVGNAIEIKIHKAEGEDDDGVFREVKVISSIKKSGNSFVLNVKGVLADNSIELTAKEYIKVY